MSLYCNCFFSFSALLPGLSALCLQSWSVNFTTVSKFHDSLTLYLLLFSITPQTFIKAVLCHPSRSSYPLLFSSFTLLLWVGLLGYCLRQLLYVQRIKNLWPSVIASRPFYFLQFQVLTLKHCSSFSCPNIFLLDLPSSLFNTEDTVKFQTHFLKSCGRTPRKSRLLNSFWILCGKFQAINRLVKRCQQSQW